MTLPFFKSKKNAAEFSRDFYNRYLFGKTLGVDAVAAYAETAHRAICGADPSFAKVQKPKFKDEMLGLQLEMIGTAWTHKSKESAAIANSEFTQHYLADKGRSGLWEVMGEYNQVVAASAHGADPNSRLGRGQTAFLNSMRVQLFEEWTAKGHDEVAIARVVNRVGSQPYWDKGVTPVMLGMRMMSRLDIEGSDRIAEKLAALAFGFYQGAKESLDGVKLIV